MPICMLVTKTSEDQFIIPASQMLQHSREHGKTNEFHKHGHIGTLNLL